jgi:hypothetical protein
MACKKGRLIKSALRDSIYRSAENDLNFVNAALANRDDAAFNSLAVNSH